MFGPEFMLEPTATLVGVHANQGSKGTGVASGGEQRSMLDGEAFTKFLGEEIRVVTGGVVQGQFKIKLRGRIQSLENLLYKYVRCELAHRACIPFDVRFRACDLLRFEVSETGITFSHKLIDGLYNAVVNAPENADLFADLRADRRGSEQ